MKVIKISLVLILLLVIGYGVSWVLFSKEIKSQQHGVLFNALPRFLGGGVSKKVLVPGVRVIVWPWTHLYQINTGEQSIEWGPESKGTNVNVDDSIYSRALDGNEVSLAVTVKYRIMPNKVKHIVERVGYENVYDLVRETAQADIRTHLNTLQTKGFIDPDLRDNAFLQVRDALNFRLNREGIEVLLVAYNGHRFERKTADGVVDATYQEKIDDAQKTLEAVNKEPQSREALIEDKKRLIEEIEGHMNQVIEEAKGYERAAMARGDNYFKKREYDARRIRTKGLKEIEGISEKIKALSGTGGKEMLRLKIAKELSKSRPDFVLLQNAKSSSGVVDVKKVDTNELIEQVGMFAVGKAGLDSSIKKNKQ